MTFLLNKKLSSKSHVYIQSHRIGTIPVGFIGQPHDVGRLALFLASDDARYLIGQTLLFDGGQGSIMPLTGDFNAPRPEQWGKGYVPGL